MTNKLNGLSIQSAYVLKQALEMYQRQLKANGIDSHNDEELLDTSEYLLNQVVTITRHLSEQEN